MPDTPLATPGAKQPGTGKPPPGPALLSEGTAIAKAAARWQVPPYILLGVWGMETDFGKNVATSSGGAVGEFQFLPSTASGYNYPLTNNPTGAEFSAQVNGAAHYLHDLKKQYGNWDTALQHYSGGGYGLAQVKAKADKAPNKITALPTAGVSLPNPLSGLDGIAQALGDISKAFSFIFSTQFLYLAAGVPVVLFGLYMVYRASGGPSVPIPIPV